MTVRVQIATSGHIGVGLDIRKSCFDVHTGLPPSVFYLVLEMGRYDRVTRFGERNMGKHTLLVTLEDFLHVRLRIYNNKHIHDSKLKDITRGIRNKEIVRSA